MRRDLPEGCDYSLFPSFGYGRILGTARMADHASESYFCVRLFGVLRLWTVARLFERRSLTYARVDPSRLMVRDVDEHDPVDIIRRNEGSLTAALLTEQDRMDAGKAARRARRHRPDMREVMP